MKRHQFKVEFDSFPSWTCPACGDGTLKELEASRCLMETGPSRRWQSHEAWEPDWIVERFVGLLECSNEHCGELVSISGHTANRFHEYGLPDGSHHSELFQSFIPKYLDPAPPIIDIPSNISYPLEAALSASFALFWVDKEACANKLRVIVEMLLDDFGIASRLLGPNRSEKSIPLHKRLEAFGEKYPEEKQFLLAVKWIGNDGSHASTSKLSHSDILDVFELLETALEELYTGKRKRLTETADRINAAKGKPAQEKPFR